MKRLMRVVERPRETIGNEERCDAAFEDAEAERRRLAHQDSRADVLFALRREREKMTWGQRLDEAMRIIGTMSTASAIDYEKPRVSVGKPKAGPPPGAPVPDIDLHVRLIAWHVREVELVVDVERGVATPRDYRMTGEEKDRIIWDEFQGVPAEQVAQSAPWLGSHPRTIEKARQRVAEALGLRERGLRVRSKDGVIVPLRKTAA